MFSFQLLTLFTAVLAAHAANAATTKIGCIAYNAGSLPSNAVSADISTANSPTSDTCASACSSQYPDLLYSYFHSDSGVTTCQCSDTGPSASSYIQGSDALFNCFPNSYEAQITISSFSAWNCQDPTRSDVTRGGYLAEGIVPSVEDCFRRCVQYDYASFNNPGQGQFSCFCFYASSSNSYYDQTCSPTSEFVFSHSARNAVAQPEPSYYVKRAQRLARLSTRQNAYCPDKLTPCNIDVTGDSYECLDLQSELQSCGGCLNGEFGKNGTASGQDCTDLPEVSTGGSTCSAGKCVAVACNPGYTLIDGTCL